LLEQQEKERMFSISQSVDEDPADNLKTFLASESKKLSLPEINVILDIFTQRKILLEAESISAQNRLLLEFLQHLLKTTENEKRELNKKIRLIKKDIRTVEDILKNVQSTCPKIEDVEKHFEKSADPSTSNSETSTQLNAIRDEMKQLISDIDSSMPENVEKNLVENALEQQQNTSAAALSQSSTYKVRKQRMFQHFEDFMTCYYTNRAEDLHFQHSEEEELMITDTNEQNDVMKNVSLDVFRENLVKFSKYSQLRTLS
jgi:E3 ubiquitin-protein ligase RFWD2